MNPSQDPVPPAPETPVTPTPDPVTPPAAPAPLASTPVAAPGAVNPGKTMGIVSLVLSIVGIGLAGIIVGAIALSKSKKAGFKNGFALAGIIVGAVGIVFGTLAFIILMAGASQIVNTCAELGSGTHIVNGVTYTCGS